MKAKFFCLLIILIIFTATVWIFWNEKSKEKTILLPSGLPSSTPITKSLDGFGELIKKEEKNPAPGVVASVDEHSFVLSADGDELLFFLSPQTFFYRYTREVNCNREAGENCWGEISQSTREEVLREGALVSVAYKETDQGFLATSVNLTFSP